MSIASIMMRKTAKKVTMREMQDLPHQKILNGLTILSMVKMKNGMSWMCTDLRQK